MRGGFEGAFLWTEMWFRVVLARACSQPEWQRGVEGLPPPHAGSEPGRHMRCYLWRRLQAAGWFLLQRALCGLSLPSVWFSSISTGEKRVVARRRYAASCEHLTNVCVLMGDARCETNTDGTACLLRRARSGLRGSDLFRRVPRVFNEIGIWGIQGPVDTWSS